MEDMYGLMNYHHEQVQATDSFDNHPDIRHKRPIPIGFGSGSNIPSSSCNNNRLAEELEEELSYENRLKIKSHPLYPKLLQAYIACQKVGAPPDIANLFDEIFKDNDFSQRSSACSCLGDDPELDEFMETYCEMLDRYRSDLARPFDEATTFLNNMQNQLTNLCKGTCKTYHTEIWEELNSSATNRQKLGNRENPSLTNGILSPFQVPISWFLLDESVDKSEEDLSREDTEGLKSNWTNEDRALKDKLLRKYSKYISSLKHEFSNKKKKGKLPKEARRLLLDWWNIHYRWPYPTEADKIALADTTGLDQKQINNWFINQRKRHWKPSENMQFAGMDSLCGSFLVNN